jgi:hypothetical protein
MTLRPGEVVLIRIDFHQTPGGKLRPAVVLLDSGDDDFVAARITSHLRVSDFDVPIYQWREAGINPLFMQPTSARPARRAQIVVISLLLGVPCAFARNLLLS